MLMATMMVGSSSCLHLLRVCSSQHKQCHRARESLLAHTKEVASRDGKPRADLLCGAEMVQLAHQKEWAQVLSAAGIVAVVLSDARRISLWTVFYRLTSPSQAVGSDPVHDTGLLWHM